MGKWTAERWAASSGIGFVVLLLVGGFLPGTPKKYDASATDIATWFHDKHKSIIVAAILFGIAYVLFLWFLASFAGTFREAGERRVATIMYGAGVGLVTLGAISDAVNLALARVVSLDADPATVKTLYDVGSFLTSRIAWFGVALALATYVATKRTSVLPEWFGWLSLVAAAVLLLGALSVKTTGFFSPTGAMTLISFLVFLAWILVASVLLVQRTGDEPVTRPAPAM
jgi:hypothetical protein